jgi:hypothetical protein
MRAVMPDLSKPKRLQLTLVGDSKIALLRSLRADLEAEEQATFSYAQVIVRALESFVKQRQNVAPRKQTLFDK